MKELKDCPFCGVDIGELHIEGCDVERCPDCGGQYISCDCEEIYEERIIWDGNWPGTKECQEYGWYSKMGKNGWEPCSKDDPEASENLNRLISECIWDKKLKRFMKEI